MFQAGVTELIRISMRKEVRIIMAQKYFEDEPSYVLESKRKCIESDMDPNEIRTPKVIMSEMELVYKIHVYEEILQVVNFFSEKILNSLKDIPILIIVSDENGFILDMIGDETIKYTINQLGIKTGIQFTQEDMGTNVISLALHQNHPVQLIGTNHYHTYLHNSACYGVPFHYTDVNDLLGSICIMTAIVLHNPFFLMTLAIVVDAIERELLLRKQNRKLNILNQIMLSKTRNAIVITNADGKVIEFNEFAEKISGFKKDEIEGKSIFDSPISGNFLKNVLKNGEIYENVEVKFKNDNNENYVCLFDAQPIHDENLKVIGAFGQFRDITERYLAEEKYKNAEVEMTRLDRLNLIGQMAAGIGHEVRNPMTTVRGFLQLFEVRPEYTKNREVINLMISELDRANSIITDFLSLANDKSVGTELLQKNLNNIINRLKPLLISDAFNNSMHLVFRLSPIPDLYLNEKEINQMLLNLVRNGFEAMDKDKTLTIETHEEEQYIVLKIKDEGKGIDPEIITKIGIPFFTTKDTGTGLGLATCYSIAARHNAIIDIESETKGTTFSVKFRV